MLYLVKPGREPSSLSRYNGSMQRTGGGFTYFERTTPNMPSLSNSVRSSAAISRM